MYRTVNVVMTASAPNFRRVLSTAALEYDYFQRKVEGGNAKMAASAATLGRAFATAGLGVAIGLGYAITKAVQFDKEMRNVNSLLHQSEAQFKQTENAVVSMSTRMPQSAAELSKGLYNIASAGYSGRDALQLLEVSAREASAGLSSTETASTATIQVLRSYGKGVGEAKDVSDILFQTVYRGIFTYDQLAHSLNSVIGTAAMMKIPFEDVGAAMAAMSLHGASAANASINLNQIIRAFIKPTKAMSAQLKDMGFESGQAAIQQLGLRGVMMKINEATHGNAVAMHALFPEIRAGRGAYQLLSDGGKDWASTAADIENKQRRAGATQRAYAEQQKSAAFQLKLLKNNIDALAITVGTALLPALNKMVRGLTSFIRGMRDGTGAGGQFVRVLKDLYNIAVILSPVIIGLAVAFAALKIQMALALGGRALGYVTTVIALARSEGVLAVASMVLSNALRALGLSWLIGMGPIGWVIAAVIAIGVAFVIAYKKVDWFRNAVNAVGAWFAGPFVNFFKSVGAWFAGPFVQFFQGVGAWFAGPFLTPFHAIRDFFTGPFLVPFQAIGRFFSGPFVGFFKGIGSAIAGAFSAVYNTVVSWLATILRPFMPWINWIIGAIKAMAIMWVGIWRLIFKTAWDIANYFFNIFKSALTGFWHVIVNAFNAIRAAVTAAWNAMWSVVRAVAIAAWNVLWGTVIRPARDAIITAFSYVRSVVSAVWNAVWNVVKAVARAAWNVLWGTTIRPARDTIVTAFNWVKTKVTSAWNTMWSGLKSAARTASNILSQIWSGLKRLFATPINWVLKYVVNGGIIRAWNWVASKVAPGAHINNVPYIPGYPAAGGGVIPGYAPGRDTVPILASPGEGILVPEAVQALGGPGAVFAINRQFSSRRAAGPLAAGGGMVDGFGIQHFALGGIISGALKKVGSMAATAGSALLSVLQKGLGTAVGWISAPIKRAVGVIGRTQWGQLAIKAASSLGNKAIDAVKELANKVIEKLQSVAAMAFGGGGGGPAGAGVQRWASIALQALRMAGQSASWLPLLLRRMQQESGGNPRAINLWDSNARRGTPSMGLMQTIGPTFNSYAGALRGRGVYDPLANIYASIRYTLARYGTLAAWGRPGGYDQGGWLPPGISLAYNGTGRPERVIPSGQSGGVYINEGAVKVVVEVSSPHVTPADVRAITGDTVDKALDKLARRLTAGGRR